MMNSVEIPFDVPNGYLFQISDMGVTVVGCDCADIINDNRIVEVYEKIGEYITYRGLDIKKENEE